MSRPYRSLLVLTLLASAAGCHRETVRATRTSSSPPAYDTDSYPTRPDAHASVTTPTRPVHLGSGHAPGATADRTPERIPPRPATPHPDPTGPPVSTEVGLASWYGPPYNHRRAADGSVFDQDALTAAHRTLPMGSMARVTNIATNQSVLVQITDRGPFVQGRILDLSLAAAKATGLYRMGVGKVKVEAFAPPPGSSPTGRWCVQVGAFAREENALELQQELTELYADAKVSEFAGPTGHWVRINPRIADKSHAAQVASGIHSPEPDAAPYLVRVD